MQALQGPCGIVANVEPSRLGSSETESPTQAHHVILLELCPVPCQPHHHRCFGGFHGLSRNSWIAGTCRFECETLWLLRHEPPRHRWVVSGSVYGTMHRTTSRIGHLATKGGMGEHQLGGVPEPGLRCSRKGISGRGIVRSAVLAPDRQSVPVALPLQILSHH